MGRTGHTRVSRLTGNILTGSLLTITYTQKYYRNNVLAILFLQQRTHNNVLTGNESRDNVNKKGRDHFP